MKVFVTGGTGFVGTEIIRQLTQAGHIARCLVRQGSEDKLAVREGVEVRIGDAMDPESLKGSLEGCDAVIHLVGIIREVPAREITFEKVHFEGALHMVEAAQAQGVGQFLHMSANGTRKDAASPYHQTKWRGEEAVRASPLQWTIFRPSLIFGPGDEFVTMLSNLIRRLPIVPVIGDGRYRMSPVAVEDVAAGFVRALTVSQAANRTFFCCGPESYSYNEVLDTIGRALGKGRVLKIHQPVFTVKPAVRLLGNFSWFPITSAQLTMLLEGNVCDPSEWSETFDIKPRPFPQGIARYLRK